jgi:hypothetical protein
MGPKENALLVEAMQRFHLESRNWNEIVYSFMVGNDGNVFEGKGEGNENRSV